MHTSSANRRRASCMSTSSPDASRSTLDSKTVPAMVPVAVEVPVAVVVPVAAEVPVAVEVATGTAVRS